MDETRPEASNISPEALAWAKEWKEKEGDYLQHRAQFAREPTRSIAKLILSIAR